MIVAGEASGDMHGAHLVRAMLKQQPDLVFYGMGGVELGAAGVELLYDARKLAVVGAVEVFSHLADIIAAQRLLKKRMKQDRPRLLILIDFPDFNLMLARKAKRLGIPVFYYVSPQVWAWRSGRVKTIGRLVDAIGVILPFEEQFYRDRKVDAHYVGNPLLDSVHVEMSRDAFVSRYEIDPDHKIVGLFPGSRKKEISALLPTFLEAAKRMQQKYQKHIVFLLSLASTITEDDLKESGLEEYRQFVDIRLVRQNRYDMMAACDAAVTKSGTVTLELAILNVPMVVVYKVSPSTYFLGRLLVKVKNFSLVNLIAGDFVVPELLQEQANPGSIEVELAFLLFDEYTRKKMQEGLALVRARLGAPGASDQAARLALGILKPAIVTD
ncbi:MAG: lipid-A-disaccharide synthase [Desulfocapsaceae bacterium]|nr:lipid-A-disaccharide synthase [Desulfocapsaceae bacterium]